MRDGILLAEDAPTSLIQAHCLSVSFIVTRNIICIQPVLPPQTLEEVFLKLCQRQEDDKAMEYGAEMTIVSFLAQLPYAWQQ